MRLSCAVRTQLDHLHGIGSDTNGDIDGDIDGDILTYRLSGPDASSFEINDDTGQITVGPGITCDLAVQSENAVTVTVHNVGARGVCTGAHDVGLCAPVRISTTAPLDKSAERSSRSGDHGIIRAVRLYSRVSFPPFGADTDT